MSNKEKNKEQYLLQDEQNLDELTKGVVYNFDERDQENKPEDVSKAIQKAKPDDVDYNEDGSITVKEEGDLAEGPDVIKILKYDLNNGGDVKDLQKRLDKRGLEPGKAYFGY